MRSVEEIESEISSVMAQLATAKTELQQAEEEYKTIAREQDNDPSWKAARWDYINKGDRSGIDNWYTRRDQRKQAEQMRKETEGKDTEAVYTADVEVRKAKRAYDNLLKNLPAEGQRESKDKIALQGAIDAYNDAVDNFVHKGGDAKLYEKIGTETRVEQKKEQQDNTAVPTLQVSPYTNGLYNSMIKSMEDAVANKQPVSASEDDLKSIEDYAKNLQKNPDYQSTGDDFLSRLSKVRKYMMDSAAEAAKKAEAKGKKDQEDSTIEAAAQKLGTVNYDVLSMASKDGNGTYTVDGTTFTLTKEASTGTITAKASNGKKYTIKRKKKV